MRKSIPLNTPRQARKGLDTPLTEGNFFRYKGIYFNTSSLPRNLKLRKRAKELRKAGFLHEVVFWEKLKGKQLCGLDFHRQQIIGNFIVDFFAPQIGLVIELDGCSHDEKEDYDKEREDYLKSFGLTIIRFSARETLQELESVIEKLKNFIEEKFPSPRGVAAAQKAADGVYSSEF